MEPYNVKHALIDPSHTFTHPLYHHTRRDFDLWGYDKKNGKDRGIKELQHVRRETFDFNGKMIYRLPERRDLERGYSEDPVHDYHTTKRNNSEFFKSADRSKVDVSRFNNGNYLTSPIAPVGIAKQKNYFVNKQRSNSTGAFFNERSGRSKAPKEDAKQKYKIMKEMLKNERKANQILDSEIKSLTENLNTTQRSMRNML
jgi:hypothetical protein